MSEVARQQHDARHPRRRGALALALMAAFTFTAHPAWSATSTTTFAVSATVISVCSVAATPLVFGNYNPVSATPLDATSTVLASCPLALPYTVGLDDGANASGGQRRMALLTNHLSYELYSDASRVQRWGSSGGELVSGTGNGAVQSLTVYGRVAAGQAVPAGAYLDTVTVTITF
jgi:spore coat protein U-like protein